MEQSCSSSVRVFPVVTGYNVSVKHYGAILALLLDGSPLSEILASLVLLIEAEKLGTMGSVLLLSDDGKRLLNGAAPRLPDEYNKAIHGIEIGEGVGSCGTAAYRGERVIVEDIETHPYWAPFKALPLKAGLKACWSEPIKDSKGNIIGTFAMYYDTQKSPTAQDLLLIAEAASLASLAIERSRSLQFQRLTSNIFKHLPVALVITNDNWNVLNANPAFYQLIKLSSEHDHQFDPHHFFQPSGLTQLTQMFDSLHANEAWQGELIGKRLCGATFHLDLTVTMFKDSSLDEVCYAWLFSDISERKRASELIDYQANFDSLTSLANRHQLFRVMQNEINSDSLMPGFSFMLMDLDHFKQVNDTLGHDKGDKLLVDVSKRISHCIDEAFLLARLGGDEFALFLPGLVKASDLTDIADLIVGRVSEPYYIDNKQVLTSISVGIARFPEDALNLEQLLNCADQAMYASKEEGRNRFHFFTQQMQQDAERTAVIHTALRLALDLEAFELNFQPIVSISTGEIVRAEVLLRWKHEGTYISPEHFIPIAESSGLIVEIGQWVRKEAMKALLELQQINLGFGLSINVSMYEFWSHELQDNLVKSIEDIAVDLTTNPFPFESMVIEITESLLMKNNHHSIQSLTKLRDMGLKVAIDDFGTGFSSLSYLSKFPLDQIKIDKSFIQQSDSDIKQQALVTAITTLSQALGLDVVAEGVEIELELDFVKQAGIEFVQGYYFYKPMSKSELKTLIS
ncbi:EAL domain-containing protein [Shewanella eurypsychrophilus]|uniref:EAL domain-containing protein n=1 Tax=Shewanella eurypsychrophilus TaxID=2593656 RepID=A0ABX6V8U2_9GAMM|nr:MULTISPECIES: EAL domain-containing protein [Shewanella]QFU22973.1 EAL domain-containing protein [Shewanella sp. YLB-09]QPG58259.1 EAL domain-containing protein [Shewanella eurypsychrophilus]